VVATQSRDNERTVLNLRHLTELLSQHSEKYQGAQKLYHWYLKQLQSPAEREWELERKLSNEAGVQLMTIHQSKGLEFKIVFLLGADKSFKEMNKTLNFSTIEQVHAVTGKAELQRVVAVKDKKFPLLVLSLLQKSAPILKCATWSPYLPFLPHRPQMAAATGRPFPARSS